MRPRYAVKSAAEVRSSIRDVLRVDFVKWDQKDSAARLLNADAADAHDTCRFDDVLDILARPR